MDKKIYTVRKVDNVLMLDKMAYTVTRGRHGMYCTCPAAAAGNKETCRHRQMVAIFEKAKRINSGVFYDYDRGSWRTSSVGHRRKRRDK